MPIFSTDSSGTPQRWSSKRSMRARLEEVAESFVAERHETSRLRKQIEIDNTAWHHLMELHSESVERAELLAAALDEANHVRDSLSRRVGDLVDELMVSRENLNCAQGEMARLIRERDAAREHGRACEQEIDRHQQAREAVLTRLERLQDACLEADQKRIREGRYGRLGTQAIRAIFGW